MKITVVGDVFELIMSYPNTGLFIKTASCVDSSKSSITIFFTGSLNICCGTLFLGDRTPNRVRYTQPLSDFQPIISSSLI